jgi:hypothetical protein
MLTQTDMDKSLRSNRQEGRVKTPIVHHRSFFDYGKLSLTISYLKISTPTIQWTLKFRHSICPLNVDLKAKLPSSWDSMWQELKVLNLRDSYLFDEDLQVPPSWFEVPLSGDLKGMVHPLSTSRRPWTQSHLPT